MRLSAVVERLRRWRTERRRRRAAGSPAAAVRALLATPDEPALRHTPATIAALSTPARDLATVGASRCARLSRFPEHDRAKLDMRRRSLQAIPFDRERSAR